MKLLTQHVEALIFTSEQALAPDEIISCLKAVYGWELKKDEILDIIKSIQVKYQDESFSFELTEIAGGFQFLSKKEFHGAIHVMLQLKEKKRLSTAALETLAIIAYKQPITKPELEHIRGVSCDYSIQKLLEKELIVIAGKSDGPGKPLLYSTSRNFMDHFGLSSVKDLPKLKDIQAADSNEIGIPSELVDDQEELFSETAEHLEPEATDDNSGDQE
jgi:segregation and condensation protein B